MSILTYFYGTLILQCLAMGFDEFYFHYRRDLTRWERIGHGLDTLTVLAVFLCFCFLPPPVTRGWLIGLMIFSCLFVTKDEWVHARYSSATEQWLHALQFILHPVVFLCGWMVWKSAVHTPAFAIQSIVLSGFALYQFIFWNFFKAPFPREKLKLPEVNLQHYDVLGSRWYDADDEPVALLRAEAKIKNPWVKETILKSFPSRDRKNISVLDVGCGAGFLTNALAKDGFKVTGLDSSKESLEVAKQHAPTDQNRPPAYIYGDAYHLPFQNQTFDVIACMDFLEHVTDPQAVIQEASRVLRPGGIFIFHTFNRNWLSGLMVIKGVEYFLKKTPPELHVLHLFIKPKELKDYCARSALKTMRMIGIAPKVFSRAFFKLLSTGRVTPDFSFKLQPSLQIGYLGYAQKVKETILSATSPLTSALPQ